MSFELCLFRHGRTVWNTLGKYQGHAEVDLDELGRGQALAVAQRCREIKPVALYSSDLRRCANVAERIADATGIASQLDARLRERDVGTWSGLTRAEIAEKYPNDFTAWRAGDDTLRPGGGESGREMELRIADFVQSLRSAEPQGSVVAVTHAGWIRSAILWVLGERLSRQSLGMPSQGSLTVLSVAEDGSLSLEAFNDRGHLLGVEPVDQEPPAPLVY